MRPSQTQSFVASVMAILAFVPVPDSKRHWQTGTLVDAGITHKTFIGGAASETRPPLNAGSVVPPPNTTPEVATYVIETDDLRLELQALVPINASTTETELKVGQAVTFALEKSTVYIRLANGHEQKLHVVKKLAKKK